MAGALCTHLGAPRDAHVGREGFWPHGVLTAHGRRLTDVTRLTFPIQLVAAIVAGFLGAAGGIWAVQYGLRSDVRDILTRMDLQQKVEEEKTKLQDERLAALREALNDMKRRVELQQYEVQRLNETIQTVKRRP